MRCLKCGTESTTGKKFCAACGNLLFRRCPKCGAENAPASAFCEDCGTALGDAALTTARLLESASAASKIRIRSEEPDVSGTLDGERKLVTALFADIHGSTELEQDLDPEEARAIVDPALKMMIDAVHHYDGYVVQSTGDGIFALFGAPLAHEDHSQRAAWTALRMQQDIKRVTSRLRAEGRAPLQIRVGLNTGEVVVRPIQTSANQIEYTPIGHTVNLASRMQTLADPGSVVTSEATHRLCQGYFAFKALGPVRVRGVSDPINVFEVTGVGPLRTRLQRAAQRGLTKFVGREREIAEMRHALELVKLGHGQVVAAIGEAGLGKSRLLFEFKATSQTGCLVLETFSISHGKASAYLPLLELLDNYFEIVAEDDARKRREKITGKVLTLDRLLEDALPYLFALLGVEETAELAQMDANVRQRRSLEAIKRIVLRESLNQPLILVFEDLHWIDAATQALLDLLVDAIANTRVLLLVNYRPEYRHGWSSKTYYAQLRLDPLGQESAEELLDALLGGGTALSPLKRLIAEKTQGNPFFMEETVQILLDEGVLIRNGTVKLTKPLSELRIPPTVQVILASRIDRLPTDEKDLLQNLAVMGKEFPLALVKKVTDKSDDELDRMLADLQVGEFIYEQPALPDVEYTFKHSLTLEVAYNSVLMERRKHLHERTGAALETLYANSLADHLDELAHHYGRSDNLAKAVEYLGQAGQHALQRSAYVEAISHLTAGIDLLQRVPDSRERLQRELPLQLAVGPALIAVKGWAAAETERAYVRARQLCDRLGNSPELFPVLFGLWASYLVRGELRMASELAEQLLRLADSANDPALRLYAQTALGHTSFWMGEFFAAREYLESAISIYEPERHRPLALRYLGVDAWVYCLSGAALTLWELGYPAQALKQGNEGIALAQRLSHPQSLALAETFVCMLRQYRREVHAAQANAESVIALSAERGITNFAIATSLRGWAIAGQGRHEEGIAQIQEGLAMWGAQGAGLARPVILSMLAERCMEAGRLDEGLNALKEALAVANEHEIRHYEVETHRLKGELLLRQHDSNVTEARGCFERAIEIARKQSAKSLELRATMGLAQLVAKQGKPDEARKMLADVYNWFTEGFDTADLKDAKALLDELGE